MSLIPIAPLKLGRYARSLGRRGDLYLDRSHSPSALGTGAEEWSDDRAFPGRPYDLRKLLL
jgi:hypothetical protein